MKETLFLRQLSAYFETHLPDIRHCSPNTIASYGDAFAMFFKFMQEEKDIAHTRLNYKNFTPSTIEEFMLWLTRERNYSATSVKHRISALNSFMKYASRREMTALAAYTVVSSTEKPKTVQSPFPYFTLDEIRILMHLPNPDKKIEKRDFVLLPLLYDSAARSQEICDLKVGDIKFGATTKVKLLGKGNKVREVPISKDVAELLRYHIKENELKSHRNKPLFLSQLGGKMTTACIRNLIIKYVDRAKNLHPKLFSEPKYSPHSFRHSKAVHMVEAGIQIIYIRDFLGHASVKSTEIYARIGQNALTKMLSERSVSIQEKAVSTANDENTPYPKFLDRARRK